MMSNNLPPECFLFTVNSHLEKFQRDTLNIRRLISDCSNKIEFQNLLRKTEQLEQEFQIFRNKKSGRNELTSSKPLQTEYEKRLVQQSEDITKLRMDLEKNLAGCGIFTETKTLDFLENFCEKELEMLVEGISKCHEESELLELMESLRHTEVEFRGLVARRSAVFSRQFYELSEYVTCAERNLHDALQEFVDKARKSRVEIRRKILKLKSPTKIARCLFNTRNNSVESDLDPDCELDACKIHLKELSESIPTSSNIPDLENLLELLRKCENHFRNVQDQQIDNLIKTNDATLSDRKYLEELEEFAEMGRTVRLDIRRKIAELVNQNNMAARNEILMEPRVQSFNVTTAATIRSSGGVDENDRKILIL